MESNLPTEQFFIDRCSNSRSQNTNSDIVITDTNSQSISSATTEEKRNNEYMINNIHNEAVENHISCSISGIKTRGTSITALVDSGNNLPSTAMSLRLFTILRRTNIIKTPLKTSTIQARSANGKGISVIGEINQTMRLAIDNEIMFQLKNFIIIRDLLTDINIGMKPLKDLNASIDFKTSKITINNKCIKMCKPHNKHTKYNDVNQIHDALDAEPAFNDIYLEEGNKIIRLYNKETTRIPPLTLQILELTPKRYDKRLQEAINALLVTKDPIFTNKHMVLTPDSGLTKPKTPVTAIYNPYNKEVKIKKNTRIATGIILSNEQQELTNTHDINNISTDTTSDDAADKKHFAATYNEKRTYIIDKLKLKEKPLIDTEEKLEKVIALMIKHWKVLDITQQRVGRCTAV